MERENGKDVRNKEREEKMLEMARNRVNEKNHDSRQSPRRSYLILCFSRIYIKFSTSFTTYHYHDVISC